MKILKYLFTLILILFPLGELLRFDIVNNIALKPLDIVVGVAALLWLINICLQKQNIFDEWKLLLFPLIGLLSLLFNSIWLKPNEMLTSFLYLARWVSYASLFYIVLGFDKKFKNKIQFLMIIDGLVILLLGFLQYFFLPSLKSFYFLGWDEHMYRMFSVFLDPNYAGAFFVLYFLFIADLFQKKKNQRTYLASILLLTLIAIFLTFSRSALLMLIAGTFSYLFLIKRKKLIFIILGAIMLFTLIFSSKFNIENMNLFREASSKARLGNYSIALKIINDRPILGVGFNSYRYAKDIYGIKMGWVSAPSHADAGVDNSFLFVMATTGIVGFLTYLLLWLKLITKTSVLVMSSTIAVYVDALFINSLFFAPLMLWMWTLIGLYNNKNITQASP